VLTKVEAARSGAVPVVACVAAGLYVVDLAEPQGGGRLAADNSRPALLALLVASSGRWWGLPYTFLCPLGAALSIVKLSSHNKPVRIRNISIFIYCCCPCTVQVPVKFLFTVQKNTDPRRKHQDIFHLQ